MCLKRYYTIILSFLFLFLMIFSGQAQEPYEGLTFYASSRSAYLYDMDKNLIHTWTSQYSVMSNAYLLKDSSVFFPCRDPSPWSGGAQQGGRLQIIKWDGEVVWNYKYSSSTYCPHHDSEPIYKTDDPEEEPTFMVICYEKVSGVNGNSDKLVEFKPTGETTAEIVWEWHASDHKTSSGNDKPELLSTSAGGSGDWTHVNNVSYNKDLDQIVIGVKSFYEVMIIDHSTTTAEAKGSTGGKYGKGGDILYRWGKPGNYGCSGSYNLGAFHCGRWVFNTFPGTNIEVPGGGNIILAHNDKDEVVEIELPGNGDGIYPRDPGEAYGPSSPLWTTDVQSLSSHQGSVQRLPNGNTLACNASGTIYEYAPNGNSVWSLKKSCSKATRYAYSYLDPETYVKKKKGTASQAVTLSVYSSPITGNVNVSFANGKNNAEVKIFTMNGKEVLSQVVNQDHFIWDTRNQSNGIYVVKVKIGDKILSKYLDVIH